MKTDKFEFGDRVRIKAHVFTDYLGTKYLSPGCTVYHAPGELEFAVKKSMYRRA